jgi:nucleoside-diphosphate-sugar epimerase
MRNKKHRIILTGGSGTLGRNFLDLVAGDHSFEVLSLLREGSRAALQGNPSHARIDFYDQNKIIDIIDEFQPTCFVHSAATGMNFPKPEWFDLIRFNVSVSLNFCESVARFPGCRFVYISTGLAYKDQGKPLPESSALDTLHPYGASKAAADILMRAAAVEFGVPLTVLRPFSFTGLWDDGTRLFPSLLRAAAEGRPMDLSPGDQLRDHCSAREVAAGILAAIVQKELENRNEPRVYNLGSGSTQPLRGLIEGIVDELGLKVDLNFGVRPYARNEPMYLVADNHAAQRDLGWTPRHNLAHAIWQLAHESFPRLKLKKPREKIRAKP